MTETCNHCADLIARLTPPPASFMLPEGALLIDGENRGHAYLKIADSEVWACDCRCHETWKWANGTVDGGP